MQLSQRHKRNLSWVTHCFAVMPFASFWSFLTTKQKLERTPFNEDTLGRIPSLGLFITPAWYDRNTQQIFLPPFHYAFCVPTCFWLLQIQERKTYWTSWFYTDLRCPFPSHCSAWANTQTRLLGKSSFFCEVAPSYEAGFLWQHQYHPKNLYRAQEHRTHSCTWFCCYGYCR